MAWLDSVKAKKEAEEAKRPERLRGKTDEQISKELEEAEGFRKKFEESESLRQGDAEKVRQISQEFENVKRQLSEAEANRNRPQPQTPEELANFIEDPDKAFSQRIGPVAAATIMNSSMTARILAQQMLDNQDMSSQNKTMDGRLFRAWASEIDAESRKYQHAQMTSPQAWIGIFYYLKGLHSDELRDPETRKKKYNFIEPSASQATPEDKKPKSPEEELTPAEKHVADKMGVTYENYAKRKKAMQFVQG